MLEFQLDPQYKKVSIRIQKEFDSKVRILEKTLEEKKITYNEIMRTLLNYGYELYMAELDNRGYAVEEIVFCQSCSQTPRRYRKFTFREEIYIFCTDCVSQGSHIITLRKIENNYLQKYSYDTP